MAGEFTGDLALNLSNESAEKSATETNIISKATITDSSSTGTSKSEKYVDSRERIEEESNGESASLVEDQHEIDSRKNGSQNADQKNDFSQRQKSSDEGAPPGTRDVVVDSSLALKGTIEVALESLVSTTDALKMPIPDKGGPAPKIPPDGTRSVPTITTAATNEARPEGGKEKNSGDVPVMNEGQASGVSGVTMAVQSRNGIFNGGTDDGTGESVAAGSGKVTLLHSPPAHPPEEVKPSLSGTAAENFHRALARDDCKVGSKGGSNIVIEAQADRGTEETSTAWIRTVGMTARIFRLTAKAT
jgi:hypothetical protein